MLSLNTDTSFKQQKNAFSMFMEVNDTLVYLHTKNITDK